MTNNYKIPKIINGCWQFSSGHGDCSNENQAINIILQYVDAGLHTFDCADIYSGVEEILGKAKSSAHKAGKTMQIHTKFVPDLDKLQHLTYKDVYSIIERSRKRLQTDCLDLLQFHWWDYEIGNYLSALKMLHEIQSNNQIKHLGLTNFNTKTLQKILDTGIKITSIQVQYSILDSRPDKGLIALCKKNDVKIFAYGTLCGGFISERWINVSEPDIDKLPNRSLIKYKAIIDESGGWNKFQMLLTELKKIALHYDISLSTLVLSYITYYTKIDNVILGISNKYSTNKLKAIIPYIKLSNSDLSAIHDFRKQFELPGDVFDLERNRSSIHGRIMKYNLNS